MSTSRDLSVALKYGLSKDSLIFRIITKNQIERGADLSWVSAFPNESEVTRPASQAATLDGPPARHRA